MYNITCDYIYPSKKPLLYIYLHIFMNQIYNMSTKKLYIHVYIIPAGIVISNFPTMYSNKSHNVYVNTNLIIKQIAIFRHAYPMILQIEFSCTKNITNSLNFSLFFFFLIPSCPSSGSRWRRHLYTLMYTKFWKSNVCIYMLKSKDVRVKKCRLVV